MDRLSGLRILVVEDGDEYYDSLSRFVPGPTYLRAHDATAALQILGDVPVDLVYLDMRFDRIPRARLIGDHAAAARAHNGDPKRGWRYLQNHQGLYILNALGEAGFGDVPTILSHDFAREPARWRALSARYPRLIWLTDTATADQITRAIQTVLDS